MRKRLGEILLESNLITEKQLHLALLYKKAKKQKLGTTLVRMGFVTDTQVAGALSAKLHLPLIECGKRAIDSKLKSIIPKALAQQEGIFPLEIRNGTLLLAMADPLNYRVLDDISFRTNLRVQPAVSDEYDIHTAIEKNY